VNERIKQLAKEAGVPKEYSFVKSATIWDLHPSLEEFAELIVRECGEIAYKTYWDNPLEVRGFHLKEAMYKRFGIKI
jgi:hypothetical protein